MRVAPRRKRRRLAVEERLVVVVVVSVDDVCTFATVKQYMLSFSFGDGKVFFVVSCLPFWSFSMQSVKVCCMPFYQEGFF